MPHYLLTTTTILAALTTLTLSTPILPPQTPLQNPRPQKGKEKYNLEPTAHYAFAGITTFHNLPSRACLAVPEEEAIEDFLVVGVPFDTATSYRGGTRFGPNGIRQGSRAVGLIGGYSYRQRFNPFKSWAGVVDCGDMPVSPFDNGVAFAQIEEWYSRLLAHPTKNPDKGVVSAITGKTHPTILALGGDHSISLPILRALAPIHGPVSVIHIDAHIDTWSPAVFAGARGAPSTQAQYSDGTPYYYAAREHLIAPRGNVHAGIRSTLDSEDDIVTDEKSGFAIIPAVDIFKAEGIKGVVSRIREIVPRERPVYVSLDIDCLDPAYAPGTAGPSAGGWSSRELLQIVVDGLEGLKVVGVDLVEVLPGLDGPAEITSVAAAELAFEILTRLVKNGG